MSAKGNLRPNLGSRAERQGRCTDASRRCNSLTAHAVAVLEPAHPLSRFLNDSLYLPRPIVRTDSILDAAHESSCRTLHRAGEKGLPLISALDRHDDLTVL